MANSEPAPKFQIFREKDAKDLTEAQIMSVGPFTAIQAAGVAGMYKPDLARGEETRVLFNMPGFSLIHAWFKADYPLPLHTHNADCLYYVIAGSLKIGTETLGARDGFFVGANVPYAYTPGPDGVELLEFRHETTFDFNMLAKGEAFWKRAVETVEARSEDWRTARMPALNA